MRKRRAFSLIEIIVCLGLVSALLSSLFYWYRATAYEKEAILRLRGPLKEERYALQRLQRVIPKAQNPFFYSSNDESVVFTFDRGSYFEPTLSGKVLGKLYFDSSAHCLCLSIWPYPTTENPLSYPEQHFVLLDGIKSCNFEFYSPPDLLKKIVDPDKVGDPRPIDGWQKEWLLAYKSMPALIKLILKREEKKGIHDHTIEYVFDLSSTILYPGDALA